MTDAPTPIVIRPAELNELRVCRRFVPAAFDIGGHPAQFMIACSQQPLRYYGAAAAWKRDWGGVPGWNVDVQVVESARRQGIGRRLVEAISIKARSFNVPLLIVETTLATDPAAKPFMASMAFRRSTSSTSWEASSEHLIRLVLPFHDRLVDRGRIPSTAQLVPLRQAPLESVADLHGAHLSGSPLRGELVLRQGLERKTIDQFSLVLLIDRQAVGLLLVDDQPPCPTVEAKIVADAYRNGFANILLMSTFAKALRERSVATFRFSAYEHVHDTHKLALRLNAQVIDLHEFFLRADGP